MPVVIDRFIHSRKFWVFLSALVGLIFASYQNDGVFSANEIRDMVMLAIGYGASIALEDGLTAYNSDKTTVSTPGGSDVTVTAPSDTPIIIPPAPPHVPPVVSTTGLQ